MKPKPTAKALANRRAWMVEMILPNGSIHIVEFRRTRKEAQAYLNLKERWDDCAYRIVQYVPYLAPERGRDD